MAKRRNSSPTPLRWGPIATLREVSSGWLSEVRGIVGASAALAPTTHALNLGSELRQVRE